MTAKSVAKLAGVSQKTVSLVMRNQGRVSAGTRERVKAAIEELGYRPNGVAAALKCSTTPQINFVVYEYLLHHHLTGALLGGVTQVANEGNFQVLLQVARTDSPDQGARLYREQWTSGTIVFAVREDDPLVTALAAAGCPTVSLLEPARALRPEFCIQADDYGGARQAVEHLLSRGHRTVGLVGVPNPLGSALAANRMRGARDALAAAGGVLIEECADTGWTVEGGYAAGIRLLSQPPRPTAVLALSDRLAVGVMRAARELGFGIPAELAIVGFDDAEWSAFLDPPLTTVRFPATDLGRLAVHRLLGRSPEAGGQSAHTTLMIRGST